ncbi:MAG TPA: P-II family nitrogen regulator [Elusimicrobiota bacterium]|nr:P-II family nitrogen regulator [Elusimicrobiota bacterium]
MTIDEALHSTPPETEPHRRERTTLKWVSCVIRPEKLDVVKEALHKLNLVGGVTLSDVRGFGRQKGSVERYKGVPYAIRFINKVKIDLVVSNDDLPQVVTLISQLAHTGRVGDGKVFITDVQAAVRIRTGEQGVDAL